MDKKTFPVSFQQKRIFLVVFLLLCLVYNINQSLFYRPVGVHQWRNSICAAFAMNYYHGSDFLHARTNSMLADDGSSDITVVELPALYYTVGFIYKIFGPHEFLYRLINLIIAFLGLLYLFRSAFLFLGDKLYAGFVSLILFTSPIFVFYANNFIPDTTCVSVSLIGLFYYLSFWFHRRRAHWYISMLLFLLAGLIKTPGLVLFFAVAGTGLTDLLVRRTKHFSMASPGWGHYLIGMAGVLTGLFVWYLFAKIYSDQHAGSVSAVEIRPIWVLSHDAIVMIREAMAERLRQHDYHVSWFLLLSGALAIMNLLLFRKYHHLLNRLLLFSLIAAIGFTLFFFRSMHAHDYYQIGNLVVLPLIWVNFLDMLRRQKKTVFKSPVLHGVLAILLGALVLVCSENIRGRYHKENYEYWMSSNRVKWFGDLNPYLRRLGISRSDLVYFTPDPSINISLYLADQKGFTDFYQRPKSQEERIQMMMERGMQTIVIGDWKFIKEPEQIRPFLGEKIGEFGTVEIYSVKNASAVPEPDELRSD